MKQHVNLLNVVPKLKDHITLYEKEDGKVRLGIRRFKNEWFHRHFLLKRLPREISVNFDEEGSIVLRYLDGKCTVIQIVEQLKSDFPAYNNKEFTDRVILFIKNLYRDKLIDYMI